MNNICNFRRVWRDAVFGERVSNEFFCTRTCYGSGSDLPLSVLGLYVLDMFLVRLSKHQYFVTDVNGASMPSSVLRRTFWKISAALDMPKLRRFAQVEIIVCCLQSWSGTNVNISKMTETPEDSFVYNCNLWRRPSPRNTKPSLRGLISYLQGLSIP